ncbi:hypothetical protein HAX54_037725 [Datura stramonium]|uniref:Uncharacterized protein n=1 Tax=Datura stramonium TaxID=4076 RepID=A0ABS8VLL8_DATST|nr:hypothetical protein [Datura stramonium]
MDKSVRSVRNQNVNLTSKMGLYFLSRRKRNTKRKGSLGNDTELKFFPATAAGIDGETVRPREEDWAVLSFCDFSEGRRGGWCLLGLLLCLSPEKEKEKKWEKMEKKREKGRRVAGVSGCFRVVSGRRSEAEAATF